MKIVTSSLENHLPLLKKDYDEVTEILNKILEGKKKNNLVLDGDYTHPTFISPELGLDNPQGEFQYFLRIKSALEIALSGRKIPTELMPSRAPDYVTALNGGYSTKEVEKRTLEMEREEISRLQKILDKGTREGEYKLIEEIN